MGKEPATLSTIYLTRSALESNLFCCSEKCSRNGLTCTLAHGSGRIMVMSFEECNLQPNGHTIAVQEYSHWKLTFKVQCLPLARLSLQKHNASTKSLHLIILAALLLCCHITFRPYASSCFLHSFYMLPTVCYILFLHFHLFLPFPPCALTIMLNPVFMLSAVSHILAFCFQLFITF